jgi:uncharacterized repeat protein (TIGR03806 family)
MFRSPLCRPPAGLAAAGFLLISALLTPGCGDQGDFDTSPRDALPTPEFAKKGGLDNPPVPVGPFLNGAFPTQTPNDLSSSSWTIVEAFPNVQFNQTLVITTNPQAGDNRLYVGSRDGNIYSMENDPNVSTAEPFMDIRDRVAVVWDGGFLGLAFHPEFGTPGSPYETTFYTYYSSYCPTTWDGEKYVNDFGNCNPGYPQGSTGGFFGTWLRGSEFQAYFDSTAGVWRGDPASEKPMFNIRLYNGSHRGGGPIFGDDGYMYIIIGDQFRYDTAQDISGNFEGGSIRVSVDVVDNGDGTWTCPSGTHHPNRNMRDVTGNSDEMTGQYYCIPDDNPWQSPAGDRFEEFYSIGHRNPHRISIDPVTGRIWSGEVGQSTREEINVILWGRNYQWPYREGLTSGVRSKPSTILGTEQPPVIDFDRTEARTIIGGYVYRGTKFPELYGKYIAGDYSTNNVWAFTLNETTLTATKDLLTVFTPGALSTFGQDKAGEIFLGDVFGDDALYALERVGAPSADPPSTLSALGAFTDTASFELSPYWIPYGLNQPFWSDGAEKSRWIALPNDGTRDTVDEQIGYSENGNWDYPVGTVLMKHFELVLDEGDPSDRTRLETRFMVRGEDARWYGVTYRWREDQSDADLLTSFETADYTITLAEGGARDQTWYFPSRQECLNCHLEASGGALGLNARQQNGDFFYPSTGRTDNQLSTWNELGMFSPALDESTLPTMIRSVDFNDVTASLGTRARSWLDSNCGYCHRPGAVNAGFDARLTTPFENQGMAFGGVRNDLGIPGLTILTPGDPILSAIYQRAGIVGPVAMPPLAKALVQTPAVEILGEWITRVEGDLGLNGINYEYYEPGPMSFLPDFDSLTPVATGAVSSFDIGVRLREEEFAFRFTSLLYIAIAGEYTFYTSSDDGSQLFIDGSLVVDNDGLHGVQEASNAIALSNGYHTIEVTMFENRGGQALSVNWEGPDTSDQKEPIGPGKLFLQEPTIDNAPPTLSDPGSQQTSIGATATLSLLATDPDNDFLYFDAAGLPPGLAIDHTTGDISGVPDSSAVDTYSVTASASDAVDVSVVSFTWAITGTGSSFCGDGTVDTGEECDDGNNANGDGCSSACALEFCGDGAVNNNGTEQCDDGNNLDGDGCAFNCTIEIVPACGDGNVDTGEECDDGNTVSGDGCTAVCILEFCGDAIVNNGGIEQCDDGNNVDGDGCGFDCSLEGGADLTHTGSIIARITEPRGSGSKDLEVIRDGDKPPVGDRSRDRQYDTYSGGAFAAEDWIGYEYATERLFGQVIFQEGREFADGGYFLDLTVQVRQGGTWFEAPGVTITPSYAGADGVSYNTYVMDFAPVFGDAIRIYGSPGGTKYFISVGELEVFGPDNILCGNGSLDGSESCDDGNTLSGDGCSTICEIEICGDGELNNNGTEACEPPGTDLCDDSCQLRAPLCGDGFLTPPEECDDGNLDDGDGCSSTCTEELPPPCGDGIVDPGEECDDGNELSGDGCSALCVLEFCGDAIVNNGGIEQCDDGNTLNGDGCGFDCTFEGGADLTQTGAIIARITEPRGSGSKDLEVIRDGDKPPVGDRSRDRQYDTYSGGAFSAEDWFGYEYSSEQLFGQVVFQEGREFSDGGFFDTITVQVRQGGTWIEAPGVTITPAYAGADGVSYNSYVFDFAAVFGDAIRVYGAPGGVKYFTSVAELEVFGPDNILCGNGALDGGESCDDGNTLSGDGCSALCQVEFCGDDELNNNGTEACEPPGTDLCDDSCQLRTPLCGDGFLTPPEECDDGNLDDGDGCSSTCTEELPPPCGDGIVDPGEECDDGNEVNGDGCSALCVFEFCGDAIVNNGGIEQCDDGNTLDGDGCAFDCTLEGSADLTQVGTIIARITEPRGSGSKDLEVIRDGDKPPIGDRSRTRQYDTYSGGAFSAEDWIGYEYAAEQWFGQVVFQEGREFSDGGYFLDLTVQVRQGGTWLEAPGVTITPAYAGADGINYNTYTIDFDATLGDAIRIYGAPGGIKYFISVGELEVFAAE